MTCPPPNRGMCSAPTAERSATRRLVVPCSASHSWRALRIAVVVRQHAAREQRCKRRSYVNLPQESWPEASKLSLPNWGVEQTQRGDFQRRAAHRLVSTMSVQYSPVYW